MKKILIVIAILSLPFCAGAQTIIFSSNMGSSASANFDQLKTPDSTIQFGYDWASDTCPAGYGYTTVPASPGGDTVGLKVTVNNTADPTDYKEGVSIYAKTAPSTSRYDVEFDLWGAYGTTGTTEHAGMVIQASGTKLCIIREVDLSTVDPATPGYSGGAVIDEDGLAFGFSADYLGDALSDYYCFMPSTRTGTPNTDNSMAQIGTWTDSDPLPPATGNLHQKRISMTPYSTAYTFPAGRTNTSTAGFYWNHIKAEVRVDTVSFYINGVKFVDVNSTLTDKKVGIIVTDPYVSVSDDPSYFLIDNFKITEVPAPTPTPTPIPILNARNWEMFQ